MKAFTLIITILFAGLAGYELYQNIILKKKVADLEAIDLLAKKYRNMINLLEKAEKEAKMKLYSLDPAEAADMISKYDRQHLNMIQSHIATDYQSEFPNGLVDSKIAKSDITTFAGFINGAANASVDSIYFRFSQHLRDSMNHGMKLWAKGQLTTIVEGYRDANPQTINGAMFYDLMTLCPPGCKPAE